MSNNNNQGPWPIIGWFVIGMAVGNVCRRHWRLILGSLAAFFVYQYMMEAYHALVGLL